MIQVEELERRALAERQAAVTALAAGARDVTVPDPDELRRDFDAALRRAPKMLDPVEFELRRRLGVA